MQDIQGNLNKVAQDLDDSMTITFLGRKLSTLEQYKLLDQKINDVQNFEVIFANNYMPAFSRRMERSRWFQNMVFTCDVLIITVQKSATAAKLVFVATVPADYGSS